MPSPPEAATCPRCRLTLRPLTYAGVALDCCAECRGLWFDGGEVERIIGPEEARPLLERFGGAASRRARLMCARGHTRMREIDLEPGVLLDGCPACGGLWMDAPDLVRLRRHLPGPKAAAATRLEGLRLRVDEAQRDADEKRIALVEETTESGARHWIFQALFRLPLEVYSPVRRRPVGTYALIAANILLFFLQLASPDGLEPFMLVPSEILRRAAPWTLLTYMFLHANLVHLAGNMYFLAIFGDNVEDRLGIGEYLALYLVGGLGAALTHILMDPASDIPMLGASGAISALLGAYAYFFPRRRIYMMIFFIVRRIPAVWYLGFWLALQFYHVASGVPGVAWWAHIGGFAFGAAAAALHRAMLRRRLTALEGTVA